MTNDPSQLSEASLANASREEIMSALFANMVIQQTNMAMMMLGKVAHPETGQFFEDVEAAKMFIDQLEMIEVKTKGNLSRQEEALLKQGLTALRMAFVEAVEPGSAAPLSGAHAPQLAPEPARAESEPAPAAVKPPEPKAPTAPVEPAPVEESRKKFSKKY